MKETNIRAEQNGWYQKKGTAEEALQGLWKLHEQWSQIMQGCQISHIIMLRSPPPLNDSDNHQAPVFMPLQGEFLDLVLATFHLTVKNTA
jgi:hypothetical protein